MSSVYFLFLDVFFMANSPIRKFVMFISTPSLSAGGKLSQTSLAFCQSVLLIVTGKLNTFLCFLSNQPDFMYVCCSVFLLKFELYISKNKKLSVFYFSIVRQILPIKEHRSNLFLLLHLFVVCLFVQDYSVIGFMCATGLAHLFISAFLRRICLILASFTQLFQFTN